MIPAASHFYITGEEYYQDRSSTYAAPVCTSYSSLVSRCAANSMSVLLELALGES